MNKIYAASIWGSLFEWYDFTLYTTMAPILSRIFFPSTDKINALLSLFAIFALGFISRPIGGIIFGRMADKSGRKTALYFSLLAMAFFTLLMGCLPTYQTAGTLSIVLLTLLRLGQGASCGGEFSTAMIFASEHAHPKNYFFSSSLVWVGVMLGTLLSSVTTTLLTQNEYFLYTVGWRLPFFIGATIGFIGLFIRLKILETPVFLNLPKRKADSLFTVLSNNKSIIVNLFLINLYLAVLTYIGIAFLPSFLTDILKFDLHKASLIYTLLTLTITVLIPLFGYLADKFNARALFLFSILLTAILTIPTGWLLQRHTASTALLAIVFIAIPASIAMAVTPGFNSQQAEPQHRATIVSLGYNLTYCLFGGTSPLIVIFLLKKFPSIYLPYTYILVFSLISLICFFKIFPKKNSRKNFLLEPYV